MIPIRTLFDMFHQLQQDSMGRRRMHESDSRVVSPLARRRVDQSYARGLETVQSEFDIVDAHCNMVNAFAAFGHEFIDWGSGRHGLEQFNATFADRKHRDTNTLVVDLIIAGYFQPHRFAVYLHRLSERLYCDSNVIDL